MQNDSHTDHQAVEMLWYMVLAIYTRQPSTVNCSGWSVVSNSMLFWQFCSALLRLAYVHCVCLSVSS